MGISRSTKQKDKYYENSVNRSKAELTVNLVTGIKGGTKTTWTNLKQVTPAYVAKTADDPYHVKKVPNILRVNYSVVRDAGGAIYAYIWMGEKITVAPGDKLYMGYWMRKTDIQTIASIGGATLKYSPLFQFALGGAQGIGAFNDIIPSDALSVGYERTWTVSGVDMTVRVEGEYKDWVYLSHSCTVPSGVDNVTAYLRFSNVTNEISGKIDLLGYTVLKNAPLSPETAYPESDAEITKYDDAAAAVTTKADFVPPLVTPEYKNAVKGRYGSTVYPSTSDMVTLSAATVKRVYDADMYTKYGEPNVLEVRGGTLNGNYDPTLTMYIPPERLALMGIVANDTTPPVISAKGMFLKNSIVNSQQMQFWISLRYGTNLYTPKWSYASDVILLNSQTTPHSSALGVGDSRFTHTVETVNTAEFTGYVHRGIQVPATVSGKAFTGIVLNFIPQAVDKNLEVAFKVAQVALVKDSVLDTYGTYKSKPEDLVFTPAASSAAGSTTKRITVKDADRITIISDSYTESIYTPKNKAYISNLSMLSDYNFENYAVSGDDFSEMNQRLQEDTPKYHQSLSFKDYGSKYAIVMSYTNDGYHQSWDLEWYVNNLKDIVNTIKAFGAEPIISTEFLNDDLTRLAALKKVADEYGLMFIDIFSKARIFNAVKYNGFWGGGHPAARTNSLIYDQFLTQLQRLPRPTQSLKIFRKRDEFSVATRDDLLFDTIKGRAKRFKEITIGHRRLADAQLKYLDAIDQISVSSTTEYSEYLKLQNKEAVSFGDYALIDVIVPSTAKDMESFLLHLSDPSVSVFGRQVYKGPYVKGYTRYQAFRYTGNPTVSVGATYKSNDAALSAYTFTVVAKVASANMLLMDTEQRISSGAGTLTLQTGTGDASIAYDKTYSGFDPAFYDQLGKPEGTWSQITGDASGDFRIAKEDLPKYMNYDKVSLLLYKAGGFSLSDVYVDWAGEARKVTTHVKQDILRESRNSELLAQPRLGNSTELAGWTTEGTITAAVPTDGVLPFDKGGPSDRLKGMVEVTTSSTISQNITIPYDYDRWRALQIKVWARVFPDIYDPNSTDPMPITEDSFDLGTLKVQLGEVGLSSNLKFAYEELVGLHWKEVTIQAHLPVSLPERSSWTIKLFSKDKKIQIAKVSAKVLDVDLM